MLIPHVLKYTASKSSQQTGGCEQMNESVVQEVGQKVAMHAVAMKPRYLSPESVPAEALEGDTAHTACMLACIKSQSPFKACISPEGSVASRGRMRLSWVAWVPSGG